MGIDASNQIMLASGKAPSVGGEHVLRKRLQKDFSASAMGPCMWDDEGNQSRFS